MIVQNRDSNNIKTKFPMKCDEAARLLAPYLHESEKREIFEYDTVYYFNVAERVKYQ